VDAGLRIFLDSNIILAFLGGEAGGDIVERALKDGIEGYINNIVVSEVIYGFLRLATGLSARRIRELLQRRDERVLNLLETPLKILRRFRVVEEAVDIDELVLTIKSYGLMPNGAIIAVTCKKHGIEVIATLDEDFKRVPWLKVIP